jgi:Cu/Ag efflux protein CusF
MAVAMAGALLIVTAIWACALLGAGCGKGEAPRYTVRGAIENLAESKGKPVALIHHEAIPDFVDGYGEKRTMHSMSMAFGLEPGVSLEGVQVGDKVEVTFVVDRERYPTFHISSLRKLPPETALTLSK